MVGNPWEIALGILTANWCAVVGVLGVGAALGKSMAGKKGVRVEPSVPGNGPTATKAKGLILAIAVSSLIVLAFELGLTMAPLKAVERGSTPAAVLENQVDPVVESVPPRDGEDDPLAKRRRRSDDEDAPSGQRTWPTPPAPPPSTTR